MARRNGGDNFQYGVCTNTDFDGNGNPCPKCASKEVQKIRGNKEFVCEECGESLTKVKGGDDPWWKKNIVLIAAAVLGVGAIGGGIYALTGGNDESPKGSPEVKLTLNHSEKTLNVGETDTLEASVSPEGTQAAIVWKASKDGIVEVQDGIVKAVKGGSGKVLVQAIVGKDTLSAICEYVVEAIENPKPITALSIEGGNFSMTIGSEKKLTYETEPVDHEENISWESSDSSIATVDDNGLVTAIKEGEASISIVANKVSASVKVKVEKRSSGKVNLAYGVYDGPRKGGKAHGIGGEVRITRSYSLDLKKAPAEFVQLNSGDRIMNTKFVDGQLKQGEIHFSDGRRKWINL